MKPRTAQAKCSCGGPVSVKIGRKSTARMSRCTVWGLYNATTEALKKGSVANIIDRHTAMHNFLMAVN